MSKSTKKPISAKIEKTLLDKVDEVAKSLPTRLSRTWIIENQLLKWLKEQMPETKFKEFQEKLIQERNQ